MARFQRPTIPPQPLGSSMALLSGAPPANPFFQMDWSAPWRTPDFISSPALPNIALLAAVVISAPFCNVDLASAKTIRPTAPQAQSYNANIFSEVPFRQTDWSTPFRVADWLPPRTEPLNLDLFTNPIPFGPFDWNKAHQQPQPAKGSPNWSVNTNLFTNPVPFAQYDWSTPRTLTVRPEAVVLNLSILSPAPPSTPGKRNPTLFMSNIGRMMN